MERVLAHLKAQSLGERDRMKGAVRAHAQADAQAHAQAAHSDTGTGRETSRREGKGAWRPQQRKTHTGQS